jgi:4-hydroxybenzoate polyprenyltransferase
MMINYDEILRYFSSRILRWKIVFLWAILVALSSILSVQFSLIALLVQTVIAGVSITAFRIWDDLDDLHFDAQHHPERVLPNSRQLHVYRRLVLLLQIFLVLMISLRGNITQVLLFLALNSVFLVLYSGHSLFKKHRSLRNQCVLMKYPLFVLIITPTPWTTMCFFAGFALYCLVSAEEILSSRSVKP